MRFSLSSCLTLASALLLCSTPAFAQTASNIYELNGNLSDSLGGPSLTSNGAAQDPNGLLFGANQGPSLSGAPALSDGTYSIELYFEFDDVTGYRKIVDFKNRTADAGLYNDGTTLDFCPIFQGPAGAFTANTPVHVILTRNDVSDLFVGYVNGVQQVSTTDDFGAALFTGTNNVAHFFRDDNSVSGEASAGSVDYIRLYDTALTQAEVTNRFNNRGPFFQVSASAPEPSALALLVPGMGLIAGRIARRRAAKRQGLRQTQ